MIISFFGFCAVICSDCSKTNIFLCLLKIGLSKILKIVLKTFCSSVSEDRYHILSYQVLHGMINGFLGCFAIEGKRGRRKKRKKPHQCILTVSLILVAEGQGARAELLCWFVLARKSSREGADQTGVKAAKSGCEPHLTLAAHSDKMLKKWFYLWWIQILNNEIIFRVHCVTISWRANAQLSEGAPLNLFWSHWFYLFIYLLLGISQQFAL